MNGPMPARVRLSLERSRTRRRVLLLLASLGEGYAGQIARAGRIEQRRVRAVLLGAPPAFAEDLAMCSVGLAEAFWDGRGLLFRITPRGLREARRLTSRWGRGSRKRFELER